MTAVLLLTTILLHAQGAAPVTTPEGEVRAAEAERIRATIENDFDALERILGEDLTYTHSNAQVDTKQEFIAILKSGRTRYRSIEPSDVRVRVFGDVALLNGRAQVAVLTNGQPNQIVLRFTSAWARREGRWQFVAWQSTRIPQ